MNALLRHAVQILSAIVVVLTMLAYLCPHINPATFSWFAFFGTAYPWLLIFNLVLLLVWIWRLNRFALYHAGVILLGWQYLTSFFGTDFGSDHIPESAITICTHNLGGIYEDQTPSDALREKRVNEYADFLQKNGSPDILCTQETSGKFYRLLAEKLNYSNSFNLKKGTVFLSRFPIEAGGEVPLGNTSNSILWADIRVGKNKLIRVYNAHLQSNRVTQTTHKVLRKGELDEGETWQEIGFVLDRVGNATSLRSEQAAKFREHIDACKLPVVVCGDFNDTPNSYVYALLSKGLKDTFREKGLGPGTTFAGDLPLLRIDYILTEKSITTFSCRVARSQSFSDHYPVFASIGF